MARRKKRKRNKKNGPSPTATKSQVPTPKIDAAPRPRYWIAVVILLLAVGVGVLFVPAVREQLGLVTKPTDGDGGEEAPDVDSNEQSPKGKEKGKDFLEQFTKNSGTAGEGRDVLSNPELEKLFSKLLSDQAQLDTLRGRLAAALRHGDQKTVATLRKPSLQLTSVVNEHLGILEKELQLARRKRPQDPIVHWLTGELLMNVGGEPDDILQYYQTAVNGGLKRPRLFASYARALFDANQFDGAFRFAGQAIEEETQDKYLWDTYGKVAVGTERFAEFLRRQDQQFGDERPDWAEDQRRRATTLLAKWQTETQLRKQEAMADNLPRVRFVIEHRQFAKRPDGTVSTEEQTYGKGEIEFELFEDQAPNTVANFITLVEEGFYDGTRIHVAVPAFMIAGGDPNTKNDDPDDDGSGDPGYFIPDEHQREGARKIFRGSLCMVRNGPDSAGSQFFITLVPAVIPDERLTVFGRVIVGQNVVDQVTSGRTNLKTGRFGKIIPGDVIVSAKLVRKRDHEYLVTKVPAETAP